MSNQSRDRLRIFLKKAGGPTKVAEKTGLSPATVSNLSRGSSDPSFKVSSAIINSYPALNPKWWFIGGDHPMWIDKPTNVDNDLVDYTTNASPVYTSKNKLNYSNYTKEQLILLIEQKDGILNDLLTGKNENLYIQKEQLSVLQGILQKLELQETSHNRNK